MTVPAASVISTRNVVSAETGAVQMSSIGPAGTRSAATGAIARRRDPPRTTDSSGKGRSLGHTTVSAMRRAAAAAGTSHLTAGDKERMQILA
jgi:hypothetical protein